MTKTAFMPRNCARCNADLKHVSFIMSKFNTEILCLDCKRKEEQHRLYPAACKAENEAVLRGDFNFPGIGKPHDL